MIPKDKARAFINSEEIKEGLDAVTRMWLEQHIINLLEETTKNISSKKIEKVVEFAKKIRQNAWERKDLEDKDISKEYWIGEIVAIDAILTELEN